MTMLTSSRLKQIIVKKNDWFGLEMWKTTKKHVKKDALILHWELSTRAKPV